ncbi:hypothetical protein QFC20_005950 [Naganishia adeliensis]|uniref:Uncharacterized protein n=2 Tax=Naganishia adeliensis TaxID=92952 RepID=A0ACC2VHI0_9TREE|nr:hypothetical protein QFC20_007348 [Naganishia adeliensis]KAJ9098523.1 hypothetical protein QFC20_005950 [Naganishia adeliensis]
MEEFNVSLEAALGQQMNVNQLISSTFQRLYVRSLANRAVVEGNEAPSSRSAPLVPSTTSLEIQNYTPGSDGHMEELNLISTFGRTDFRTFFGIDPRTWHHPVLRPLSLHTRYARQTSGQIREMLFEARDRRVTEARRVWEAKTDKEKASRKWQTVESVMGADISEVAGQLERMVRDSMPVVKKRKRRPEDPPKAISRSRLVSLMPSTT